MSLYQLLRLDSFLLLPSSGYSVSSSYQMYRGKAFFVRFFSFQTTKKSTIFCYNQYISGYSIPFWKRHDCSHSQDQTFEHHYNRTLMPPIFFANYNRTLMPPIINKWIFQSFLIDVIINCLVKMHRSIVALASTHRSQAWIGSKKWPFLRNKSMIRKAFVKAIN